MGCLPFPPSLPFPSSDEAIQVSSIVTTSPSLRFRESSWKGGGVKTSVSMPEEEPGFDECDADDDERREEIKQSHDFDSRNGVPTIHYVHSGRSPPKRLLSSFRTIINGIVWSFEIPYTSHQESFNFGAFRLPRKHFLRHFSIIKL